MPIWSRDAFVSALAVSLLHSLWQGAILGLLGVALNGRLQRARPDTRCGVFSLLLLAVFVVWLGTFCALYGASAGTAGVAGFPRGAAVSGTIPAPPPQSPGTPWAASLLRSLYPVLTGFWALGVCLLTLRHLGGSLLLHRLCRTAATPCPAEWRDCAERLAARMGIRRKIALRCSSRIDVPCAFGLLRSCILLPLSAMAGLTPEQAEALIAHELAHIARNDVLFNTIQVCLETAMFYHPAVRWLSAQIRIAREHDCDDLVVQVIGDRAVYARALFSLEEARVSLPRLALGASGENSAATDTHLIRRIRRVLGVSIPERSDTWARGVVAAGAATVALATFHPVHASSPILWAHNRLLAATPGKKPHRNAAAIANGKPLSPDGSKSVPRRRNAAGLLASTPMRYDFVAVSRRASVASNRAPVASAAASNRVLVVAMASKRASRASVMASARMSKTSSPVKVEQKISQEAPRPRSASVPYQDARNSQSRPFAIAPPSLPTAPAEESKRGFQWSNGVSKLNGYKIALNGVALTPNTILLLNGTPGRFGDMPSEQQELLRQTVKVAVPHLNVSDVVNEQVHVYSVVKTIVVEDENRLEVDDPSLTPDTGVTVNGKHGRLGDLTPAQQQQIRDKVREVQKAIPMIVGNVDDFKNGPQGSTVQVRIFGSPREGQDNGS